MAEKYRVVALISDSNRSGSGRDSLLMLEEVYKACESGELDAEIVSVFSDRKNADAVAFAQRNGLHVLHHAWGPYNKAGKSRLAFDLDLAVKIRLFSPDLVVVLDWSHPLFQGFIKNFNDQLIDVQLDLLMEALKTALGGEWD